MMGQASAPPAEKRRLTIIELNEFNREFLQTAAPSRGFKHFQALLELPTIRTVTEDKIEHQGLDPWVQWVCVHSGMPTSEHGIRRLGDTRSQTWPQLWNKLGAKGLSWGVWGVMNAPRGDAAGCKFFMPDPWSFDERADPEPLNQFLDLPRYVSRNYIEPHKRQVISGALKLMGFLVSPPNWTVTARFTAAFVGAMISKGLSIHTLSTLFDYLSVLVFCRLKKRHEPDFSLVFVNTIAHLQHQFWERGQEIHPEMELGLRLTDRMLGEIMGSTHADEALIVLNGLGQKNVQHEGIFVYRQRNTAEMLRAMGLGVENVEQCMTHDAHVRLFSPEQAEAALGALSDARLSDGSKAFYVERTGPCELFFQVDFEHDVPFSVSLTVNGKQYPFYDLFEKVCERTGVHVPEGYAYSRGIALNGPMPNHRIHDAVLAYFGITAPAAEEATEQRISD